MGGSIEPAWEMPNEFDFGDLGGISNFEFTNGPDLNMNPNLVEGLPAGMEEGGSAFDQSSMWNKSAMNGSNGFGLNLKTLGMLGQLGGGLYGAYKGGQVADVNMKKMNADMARKKVEDAAYDKFASSWSGGGGTNASSVNRATAPSGGTTTGTRVTPTAFLA